MNMTSSTSVPTDHPAAHRALDLEATAELAAPAHEAWAVIADYARDPEWRTGVLEMTPRPAGLARVGTTTAETMQLGGRTYRNDGEVVAADDGVSFAWRTTEGAEAWGSRRVEPVGPDHCRVRLQLHVVPHGAERLLAPILRRMLARNLRADLDRLASLLDAPVDEPVDA